MLCGPRVDVVLGDVGQMISAIRTRTREFRDKRRLRMQMSIKLDNSNSFGYVIIIPAIKVSGKVIDNSNISAVT